MDKMGQNFHKIEAVRLEGGDPPPPPKAVSLTAFFPFFLLLPLECSINYQISELPIFVHCGQIMLSKAKKKSAWIKFVSKVIAAVLLALLAGEEAVSSADHPGLSYKRATTIEGTLWPLDDIHIIILI